MNELMNNKSMDQAVKVYNNYRLDKTHTLIVNIFTDFQKYENIPVEWSPPTPQPYTPTVDLYNFLTDLDAYDQYCVVDNTEQTVKWSPLGTYIVAFHKQGVAIWGGPQFLRINKFPHPGTTHVDFSPKENWMATSRYTSLRDATKGNWKEPQEILSTIRGKGSFTTNKSEQGTAGEAFKIARRIYNLSSEPNFGLRAFEIKAFRIEKP